MLSESTNNAVTRRDTAATALPAETKLTRCVYTVRLHARCTFTRSVARAYRTSGGRVISVLRSFFSPPSQRSTIVFFKRNVNFLLTATVEHTYYKTTYVHGCKLNIQYCYITIPHSLRLSFFLGGPEDVVLEFT